MHGIPKWFEWLMEYGLSTIGLLLLSVFLWLIVAVVLMIKGWTFKIAVIWPVFFMIYRGPQ